MVKSPKKALTEGEKHKRIEVLQQAHAHNRLEGDPRSFEEVLADPLNQAWIEGTLTMAEVIERRKAQYIVEQSSSNV
jgi:hypothetical protein